MTAAVYTGYGSPDVVQITDVEKPVPKDNEVSIKVRAASVNPLDAHLMKGQPYIGRLAFGLRKPNDARIGRDVAGQVETVGAKVTQFRPGDEVFGACRGAFAEYACPSESNLAMKPDNVTFEEAASVPVAALTALQGLRDKGQVQPGQRVLINGAAGGVGTFAVQIAKWLGADVTGVCSTRNVDMVRSIGADHVTDYTQEDFTLSKQGYDVIFDLVGNHSFSAFRRVLNSTGTYIAAGVLGAPEGLLTGPAAHVLKTIVVSWFVRDKLVTFVTKLGKEDLNVVRELMASGKVTPVIDKRYRLSEVAQAIGYLAAGHARGKVVITIGSQPRA
jgi:NADPH:quinone reductase-like Zn-dependent oxidoreductase